MDDNKKSGGVKGSKGWGILIKGGGKLIKGCGIIRKGWGILIKGDREWWERDVTVLIAK